MRNDILVVEISGKRPGDKKARPTENFDIKYDHLIISNNSEGYQSDWQIVNVPDDYKKWYIDNFKMSDSAWYAPMNRTYSIKYAKEHGYKYLIQLDDNINGLKIAYQIQETEDIIKLYKVEYSSQNPAAKDMLNDFIDMIVCVLENTNAGMVGCSMKGAGMPSSNYLAERYCYSLFGLKLDTCSDWFQGDFEDDVEYRLRLCKRGIPAVQICPLLYGKTAQGGNKDLSGCRQAYFEAGLKRGEHMRKLYGDVYSAGWSSVGHRVGKYKKDGTKYFKHKLKSVKIGVKIKNKQAIDDKMLELFRKYAIKREDKIIFKELKTED